MNSSKREGKFNNFIVQGGILAAAGIVVRMLGLIKRVPLTYIIGDVGNSYYSAAYEIYNLILIISSYSLPLAVSKLVSARINKGQYRNANKVFRCALSFAIIVGLISATVVFVFADELSKMMREPMSSMALKVLAPTLLVVAIMGVLRGYFQGIGTMVPTAVSQIIEQVILIIVSLTAAYLLSGQGAKVGQLLQNENYKNAYGAAGATLGCCIGAAAALGFLVMLYSAYIRKFKKMIYRDPTHIIESTTSVYKILFMTIVPVVLSTAVYNISNFLDQYLHNMIMMEKGLEAIKSVNWGIYSGKYLVLISVPIAIANAMSASSVPTISGIMKRQEYEIARDKIGSVIRITMMVTIPCAVGLAVLAPSVMWMLFQNTTQTAPTLLRIGALGIVLFSLSTLTNGILQGMSKMRKPVIHALVALTIHIILLVTLLKFTDLNIYAVALSNNVFSLIMCILNGISIKKSLSYKQEIAKSFALPIICSGVMGVIIFVLDMLMSSGGYSRLKIILIIVIGAIVYFVLMIILKGITKREMCAVPGGTRIYHLLHRFRLM